MPYLSAVQHESDIEKVRRKQWNFSYHSESFAHALYTRYPIKGYDQTFDKFPLCKKGV